MSCTRSLTISEASSPARIAHWPMEVLSGANLVDCVSSIPVPFATNVLPGGLVGYVFEPGLIGNALHFYEDLVQHSFQVSMGIPSTQIAPLKHDGQGFSLCAWMKINAYGEVAGIGYGSIGRA